MLSLITLSDYVMTYDYVYCDVIRWFYFAKTIKRTERIRLKEEKVDLGKKFSFFFKKNGNGSGPTG